MGGEVDSAPDRRSADVGRREGPLAGLDPATLLEVFNAGTGRNTATAQKFPDQVLTRRFASGFRLELMAVGRGRVRGEP
jgi:hypothetical protein